MDVGVTLLTLNHNDASKVAIASLFTQFYGVQSEYDDLADLAPDDDRIWDGAYNAEEEWKGIERLLNS